jgi:hypothetical protein
MSHLRRGIVEKRQGSDGSVYYREGKEEYRRIAGGLAWPGSKPGFAVVVAEGFRDPTFRDHPYYVLAEVEDMSLERLLQKCFELQRRWGVEEWYGQADDTPAMVLVSRFNEALTKSGVKEGIYVQYAPFVEEPGCFKYYTDILFGRLSNKSLHIGEDKKLSVYIFDLPPDKRVSASPLDFPAVAALGFAVAALETYDPTPVLPGSLPEKAETDYNMFE